MTGSSSGNVSAGDSMNSTSSSQMEAANEADENELEMLTLIQRTIKIPSRAGNDTRDGTIASVSAHRIAMR